MDLISCIGVLEYVGLHVDMDTYLTELSPDVGKFDSNCFCSVHDVSVSISVAICS